MKDQRSLQVRDVDTVIIGAGVAGLTAALRLGPRVVTVLTKTATALSGASPLAQGGIAAALGAGDTPDSHAADTVAAGAGFVDKAVALLLAREGVTRVQELLAAGLPADCHADGTPRLGREAAHSHSRIVHAGGDATGRAVVETLLAQVRAAAWIRVETEACAVDLVVHNGRVCGVLARHQDGWVWHRSARVVLACGGIGTVFRYTTNPAEATGDGLALAARAGARLADLEFVQFHPTALAVPDAPGGQLPLLTEALRGDGAVLLDGQGQPFMRTVHPLADLAPRDVVARAVWRRVAAGEPVLLDLRPALALHPDGFPTVLALCAQAGFDPWREPVPVMPAAHYHMGGVLTDNRGRTSLDGLWACGEVACTGVHGANRLASNSLLEGLVFGRRVAADIAALPVTVLPPLPLPLLPTVADAAAVSALAVAGRQAVYAGAGLERTAAGLEQALHSLGELAAAQATLPEGDDTPVNVRRWSETRNLLLVGHLIAAAALRREESRGAHYRSDFPAPVAHARRALYTLTELAVNPVAALAVAGD